MSRSRLAVAAGALLLALAVGLARRPEAHAHALLVRSDPPINAALRESPQERWDLVNFLRANFDEPIEASGSSDTETESEFPFSSAGPLE